MKNYKYTFKETITSVEESLIKDFISKCAEKDNYFYDLQYEEKILSLPSYYYCYSNNTIIGLLTVCEDSSDTLCIYSLVSKNYRKNHIFTNLLELFYNNLNSSNHTYTTLEFHLPDDNLSFYNIAKLILDKFNFSFSHNEYLLSFSLLENSYFKTINTEKSSTKIEIFFDEKFNEFTLWLGDSYIGGCMIYFSEQLSNSFATIYDYKIEPEYRGKGYGKTGLQLILTELKNMQYNKALLHVSGLNKKAHNLYISCGFKIKSSINIFTKNI